MAPRWWGAAVLLPLVCIVRYSENYQENNGINLAGLPSNVVVGDTEQNIFRFYVRVNDFALCVEVLETLKSLSNDRANTLAREAPVIGLKF